jgi:hypothetical protein
MARRPFFGQNDTKIAKMDMQAATAPGRAYAAAFKGLGEDIGGAIEKYQLNKEKQKKNEGFIKSQSGMLDMLAEQDPEMASQYSAMKEQLNNPDVPLATRAEFGKNLVNNITLSSQLKGQRLLQDTQAQTLEEQKATAKLRQELVQQKRDLNKIVNNIKSIDLANLEALSPIQREETLARLRSSINLIPSEEAATRSANTARGLQSDTASAYILGQGGPAGMAKQQMEDDDLKRRGLEADIRTKDTLSDYRIKSIELLEGKSNLPQGSGNEEIETSIKNIDSEIDRIMKGQTFSKDSDGNTLSYSDLIEDIDPITGEVTLSEDASNYASRDIARLKELIQDKMQLRLSQTVKVPNVDGVMIEVTYAELEEQKAKKRMKEAEIQNAVRSSPPAFPIPDYH